jgi:oxygen-independent coproporphyrinogen-3 oxidase
MVLHEQSAAFYAARDLITAAGMPEYASGYFGPPALNVVMPFQLRLETAGFGSGAVSLLDGRFSVHRSGRLGQYVESPMDWDFSAPASSPGVAFSFLRSGLSVVQGILRAEWCLQTGDTLDVALAHPGLARFVRRLRDSYDLIETAQGIRLPADTAGQALLEISLVTALLGRHQ